MHLLEGNSFTKSPTADRIRTTDLEIGRSARRATITALNLKISFNQTSIILATFYASRFLNNRLNKNMKTVKKVD